MHFHADMFALALEGIYLQANADLEKHDFL